MPIRSDGLKTFGDPYLMEDTVKNRLLLTATAQADGATRLGTYVWTSTSNGASWSLPIQVWDSFGTGQSTPDGHGGFYTIVDTVGAAVTHVPASLAVQKYPDDEIVLTDALDSRGVVGVATLGPSNMLMFAWVDPDRIFFIHSSDTPGRDHDHQIDVQLAGDTWMRMVGGPDRGLVVNMSEHLGVDHLYSCALKPFRGGQLVCPGFLMLVTHDIPVSFAIGSVLDAAGQPTGEFRAIWFDDHNRLRTALSRYKNPWTAPKTLVQFPTASYSFPNQPAVAQN